MKKIQILPGEFFFTADFYEVSTILGSCVSVTCFHPVHKIAGIFHSLLAIKNGNVESKNVFNYTDYSLNYLLDKYEGLGINLKELEIKLFGGSDMLCIAYDWNNKDSVGKNNISIVKKILRQRGLDLVAEDSGGVVGRKIIFYTDNGKVYRKFLENNQEGKNG